MNMPPDRLDRLYDLLPVVHRMRDFDEGEPLRALLRVVASQVNVIDDDIARLYENWFIETCEDWVVPYIGQLVGYQPAGDPGLASDHTTPTGRARARAIFPRADVAHTVRNRRRKGTLALLELLAADSAGWPARAVEFYRLLAWSQNVKYPHIHRARTVDLRQGAVLDQIGSPFDTSARIADVRRIASHRRQGRHNIPNVGLFAWRLKTYPVTRTRACNVEGAGPHCLTFSVLCNDAPLFNWPLDEPGPNAIAGEKNLPVPIRRRALEQFRHAFNIEAPGWLRPGEQMQLISADLTDWAAYRPRRCQIAVDPVLGRMLFPPDRPPREGVVVSYRYAFSADMGGGEYNRTADEPAGALILRVGSGDGMHRTIRAALDEWSKLAPKDAVIEFTESGVFTEPIAIDIPADHSLELRAGLIDPSTLAPHEDHAPRRARPVIRLLDWRTDLPDSLMVNGASGSRFSLDGLLITGRPVRISGELAHFSLRHSTLVPGWDLDSHCDPRHPAEPALEIASSTVTVCIEHSIVGSIQVSIPPPANYQPPARSDNADRARCGGFRADPLCFQICDSIVDATGPEREALGAAGCEVAHVRLRIARSTVFGKVQVHAIEHAQDCIFAGQVFVARRQIGCIRFSYVEPGSRTPRRFHCQPDGGNGVEPRFTSVRYGHPAYAQLALDGPCEIARGASDQSEMGAFHDLYQPQRTDLLRARLNESVPAGSEAGIIFAT